MVVTVVSLCSNRVLPRKLRLNRTSEVPRVAGGNVEAADALADVLVGGDGVAVGGEPQRPQGVAVDEAADYPFRRGP
jgi:hypothetical protein